MSAPCDKPDLTPWLDCLRRLAAGLKWSDRAAAQALSILTLPALEQLRLARWKAAEIERLKDECKDGWHEGPRLGFSRDKVRYWRRAQNIPASRPAKVWVGMTTTTERLRSAQIGRGWVHLLPGRLLSPRETEILCVLRDNAGDGGIPKRTIVALLALGGYRSLKTNNRSSLCRLERDGLVRRSAGAGTAALYAVAASALAPEVSRRQTSVDSKYGSASAKST